MRDLTGRKNHFILQSQTVESDCLGWKAIVTLTVHRIPGNDFTSQYLSRHNIKAKMLRQLCCGVIPRVKH